MIKDQDPVWFLKHNSDQTTLILSPTLLLKSDSSADPKTTKDIDSFKVIAQVCSQKAFLEVPRNCFLKCLILFSQLWH